MSTPSLLQVFIVLLKTPLSVIWLNPIEGDYGEAGWYHLSRNEEPLFLGDHNHPDSPDRRSNGAFLA